MSLHEEHASARVILNRELVGSGRLPLYIMIDGGGMWWIWWWWWCVCVCVLGGEGEAAHTQTYTRPPTWSVLM
jgi:hypothetical protein